jgi:hypothetical protein
MRDPISAKPLRSGRTAPASSALIWPRSAGHEAAGGKDLTGATGVLAERDRGTQETPAEPQGCAPSLIFWLEVRQPQSRLAGLEDGCCDFADVIDAELEANRRSGRIGFSPCGSLCISQRREVRWLLMNWPKKRVSLRVAGRRERRSSRRDMVMVCDAHPTRPFRSSVGCASHTIWRRSLARR